MTDKPQYTGTMLDELFAKVDEALETGKTHLANAKRTMEQSDDEATDPKVPSL
jgi:hypothetical protein